MYKPFPPAALENMSYENLECLANNPSTPDRLKKRIWILLAASLGHGSCTTARHLGISRKSASKWRERIDRKGSACIFIEDAGGRPRRYPDSWVEAIREILAAPNAPSLREHARELKVNPSIISRALRRPPKK